MDFDLAPPIGVGPLRIGMTRQSATTALDSLRDLSAISDSTNQVSTSSVPVD
ncbi:hypothetical protein [Streptomyces sp. NPDC059371]|uniref:hypothetical protein n=1 Tax=Streptomyces sp. NPDC059371 TaxID=3346812 RepID=UPI0036B4A479